LGRKLLHGSSSQDRYLIRLLHEDVAREVASRPIEIASKRPPSACHCHWSVARQLCNPNQACSHLPASGLRARQPVDAHKGHVLLLYAQIRFSSLCAHWSEDVSVARWDNLLGRGCVRRLLITASHAPVAHPHSGQCSVCSRRAASRVRPTDCNASVKDAVLSLLGAHRTVPLCVCVRISHLAIHSGDLLVSRLLSTPRMSKASSQYITRPWPTAEPLLLFLPFIFSSLSPRHCCCNNNP
ncbi:hypothetical protein CORC01_03675, partial [Colletotrichum orchidophilum]